MYSRLQCSSFWQNESSSSAIDWKKAPQTVWKQHYTEDPRDTRQNQEDVIVELVSPCLQSSNFMTLFQQSIILYIQKIAPLHTEHAERISEHSLNQFLQEDQAAGLRLEDYRPSVPG